MLESLFRQYNRVVFFDTETTGLNPGNDQMIELAAIAVDRDGTQTEMDEYIQLERLPQLPGLITEMTRITDAQLAAEGIGEKEAVRKFIGMIEQKNPDESPSNACGTLLVAHNAQFHLLFLTYAILRHREEEAWKTTFSAACDYLDTLTVYRDRRAYPNTLADAIWGYGLSEKVKRTHRAGNDCRALFEVTKRMEEEKGDLNRYVNLFGFYPMYGPAYPLIRKVEYIAQDFDPPAPLYVIRDRRLSRKSP